MAKIQKSNSNRLIIGLIVFEVIVIIASILFSIFYTGNFQNIINRVDTVVVGNLDLKWTDNSGQLLTQDDLNLPDIIREGDSFTVNLNVKNFGTINAYIRVKTLVEYRQNELDNWIYAGDFVNINLNNEVWIDDMSGYYYYSGLTTNQNINQPKVAFLYPNDTVLFTTQFTFTTMPSNLKNKSIRVRFICDGVQATNEAVEAVWDNVIPEWLDIIGITPEVYVLPISSAKTNGVLTIFNLNSDEFTDVSVGLFNRGLESVVLKVDVKVIVNDPDFPVGNILFDNGEWSNFTFSTNDRKFYYNLVLDVSDEVILTLSVSLLNEDLLELQGKTYTVEFIVEAMKYNVGVNMDNEFFSDAPDGWEFEVSA